MYYIGEEISNKFNLILRNDGDKYLEDVSIQIKIPNEDGVVVMDCIHKKPVYGIQAWQESLSNVVIASGMYYPNVEKRRTLLRY